MAKDGERERRVKVNGNDIHEASTVWRDKEQQKVLVYLANTFRIEGWAHLVKNQRLLDLMNDKTQTFIPLTNVTLFDLNTSVKTDADFMAVNKSEILFIMRYSETAVPESGD